MDLAFQVPMQCFSLQHYTLLSPPDPSTTGHIFCFSSASSLLLISLFFSSSILGTYQPGDFIFQCHIFCFFILFMGFSREKYLSGLPFSSLVGCVLSELSTITHPSWVALLGMAHNFIELDSIVIHVISLVSFLPG